MKYITKANNKYWQVTEECNIDKLLYLLIDKPDLVNRYNDFFWVSKSQYHRNYNLPAIAENITGYCIWYNNGQLLLRPPVISYKIY